MKKDLLNVDLISINCVNPQASVAAINYCQKFFNFGKSILVTHIEPSEYYNIELHQLEEKIDWNGYNDQVLNLKQHSDNDFVMVIQEDGHIVNPNLWDDEFLKYDYIGAPLANRRKLDSDATRRAATISEKEPPQKPCW